MPIDSDSSLVVHIKVYLDKDANGVFFFFDEANGVVLYHIS